MRNNSYYTNAKPLLVAVDCIILGFDKNQLKLLLFKRKIEPFINEWSLIGSFVKPSESVSSAANRVLKESTGLKNIFMEPLACYSEVERDPGARVISHAYYSLIRLKEKQELSVKDFQAKWFHLDTIPPLILDHDTMIKDALEMVRYKAKNKPIGFELLPKKFTIPQLQTLYEAIYQKNFDRRNFRKKVVTMNILEKLEEKDKTTSRKGAFLYRFNEKKYAKMIEKGIDFIL